ncbi:MAG: Ig-like domain-containing protein [Desulfobacterales bacterium]
MRSITFEIKGSPSLRIAASEREDGSILFDLLTVGDKKGDIQGLFFNLTDNSIIDSLGISGADVTGVDFDNAGNFKDGNNIKGVANGLESYDVGIDFGTPGRGRDLIDQTTFIMSSTNGSNLTLDLISQVEFAVRTTSTGQKLSAIAPSAPDAVNDIIAADEDIAVNQDSPNSNLLANDTDKDGDRLTIVDVNGDEALVGSHFTLTTGGILKVNGDGMFDFDPDGQYEDLAVGETRSDTFTYRITDELSDPNNQGFDTATVEILVEGRNDQPVAENITANIGEDDSSFQGAFVATDVDATDVLSFEILGQPEDNFGNQYGAAVNNGDGTFTFSPLDNFQFLEEGETRDVTFDYVAIDDSGAENATSDPKSVTVTVEGAYDAPVSLINDVVFETQDQSMWASGDAFVMEPDLPFLGLEWDEWGTFTIIESMTIIEGIDWLGIPSLDIPEIGLSGWTKGKVGLQPYFSMTSGDVDSRLPMEIGFTMPKQVEQGESFTIETDYSLDSGATFNTASPNVSLALDLIFELEAGLSFDVGSDKYNFGDFDIDETIEMFDFSAEDVSYTNEFIGKSEAELGKISVGLPEINTEGTPDPDNPDTTLLSEGEDSIMELALDVDGILSEALFYSSGVPIPLEGSFEEGLSVAGFDIATAYANYNIFDIEMVGDLKAVQDFSLNIEDLPLKMTLEDESIVEGFTVGDEVALNAPIFEEFDVDKDGDGDGLLDYDVAIDMEAIFNNLTSLGFDLSLDMEALSGSAGVSSELFSGGISFGPVWEDSFELFSTDNFATLFDSDPEGIELLGFNQETFSGQFDIA